MLILPLHHRVEVRRLPWMSLLIAVVCVFVHLGPQQGDAGRRERAAEQYRDAGLEAIEAPLYAAYADAHADALSHAFGAEVATGEDVPAELLQIDRGFRAALARGEGFDDAAAHAAWQQRSAGFRQTLETLVDERFAMSSDAPSTWTAFTSTFLHGSVGHLFGNLVFLLMLGLLVERALGPWLHLALYLLSGVAAAWVWALTHAGPPTLVLGASGAIAGLMGALCVLWGMRRIRFFYWFFVVFDYVRAPALVLLPAWLGWELLQWATDVGSNIAYQAHAGGIVAGALLALGVKALHWDRIEAYSEPVDDEGDASTALDDAQAALGRLDFGAVDRALEPLLARMPVPLEARLLALRAAQIGARDSFARDHASALLREARAVDRFQVLEALSSWRQRGGRWRLEDALSHASLLLDAGRADEAVALLTETARDAEGADGASSAWAARWLRLGFDRRRDGDDAAAQALFAGLVRALPETPEAAKAQAQLGA
jgi:membrane associated rhomboid family serine protease